MKRIETHLEVETFIERLKHALSSSSVQVRFQIDRRKDHSRSVRCSNRFTMGKLFPNEDEIEAVKRELKNLTVEDYIETLPDTKFPDKSDMRVFGKKYATKDVYIKVRVDLHSKAAHGGHLVLVLSFHFAEWVFKESDFPYK